MIQKDKYTNAHTNKSVNEKAKLYTLWYKSVSQRNISNIK